MKNINIVFNALSIIFLVILIYSITQINFDDVSYKENSSQYILILSMTLMAVAMQMIKLGINKK